MEDFLYFQITVARDVKKWLFSDLCKHNIKTKTSIKPLGNAISIKHFLSLKITTARDGNKSDCFITCVNTTLRLI
jgi:hypothetical protein